MILFQAEIFKKYSRKIVCADSTHTTNPYSFKLLSIVVPDEFKNGDFFSWITCVDHIHVP